MTNEITKKEYEIVPTELAKAVSQSREEFDAETKRLNEESNPEDLIKWLQDSGQIPKD